MGWMRKVEGSKVRGSWTMKGCSWMWKVGGSWMRKVGHSWMWKVAGITSRVGTGVVMGACQFQGFVDSH